MSRANGEVIKDGQTIAWFIWNGTVDCVWNGKLFNSADDAWNDYRKDHVQYRCNCDAVRVPVTLYTDYGSGCHWPGSVCLTCRAIVDGRDTEDIKVTWGDPNA